MHCLLMVSSTCDGFSRIHTHCKPRSICNVIVGSKRKLLPGPGKPLMVRCFYFAIMPHKLWPLVAGSSFLVHLRGLSHVYTQWVAKSWALGGSFLRRDPDLTSSVGGHRWAVLYNCGQDCFPKTHVFKFGPQPIVLFGWTGVFRMWDLTGRS